MQRPAIKRLLGDPEAGNFSIVSVAGPEGLAWRDTTIRGDVRRGTDILDNEPYAGVRSWSHKHSVKDPRIGKEVMRLNPESAWIRQDVPELCISWRQSRTGCISPP